MFPVDIQSFFAVMIALAVAIYLLLEFYALRRDRMIQDNTRINTTYVCIKCKKIYTRKRTRKMWERDNPVPCPECGFKNTRLKF